MRPYARFARVTRETASPFLKAASIMRVKGEKRNVSSYPWKLCGRYTFHAFLSTPFQPPLRPTRSHTRKLVHPFGYVFRTLGSLSESTLLRHPAYASFSTLRDSVCVCVCVGHPRVWPSSSLLSPCARFHPFLCLSLESHECPRKYRTWKWGERLLNFLPVFYYSGKLSTAFQARALYGRFR